MILPNHNQRSQVAGSNRPALRRRSGSVLYFLLLLAAPRLASGQACDSCSLTATIEALSNGCRGGTVLLKLAKASGRGPYNLTVNNTRYFGILPGEVFAMASPDESIWGATGSPQVTDANDNDSIEVGTRFMATKNGYVTGIRFYKGIRNEGVHTGSLWSPGGELLASATFTQETSSGWQEVSFSQPVNVVANTVYTASYFSSRGYYAFTGNFFDDQPVINGSLRTVPITNGAGNGVYRYGRGFPDRLYNHSNYWVDVLFTDSIHSPRTTTYTLTRISDADGNLSEGAALSIATITHHALPSGSLHGEPQYCQDDSIKTVFLASSGHSPFSLSINGNPFGNISHGAVFPTGMVAAPVISIWGKAVLPPGSALVTDQRGVELGLQFVTSGKAEAMGVRFYKPPENTGMHTGSLWQSDGTLLATGTFTSESSSGWQEMRFASPVLLVPNTGYIVSYHSSAAGYIHSKNYFTNNPAGNALVKPALTGSAAANNGLFLYSDGGSIPSHPSDNVNYWVDVVLRPDTVFEPEPTLLHLVEVTDANRCTYQWNDLSLYAVQPFYCAPSLPDSLEPVGCAPATLTLFLDKPVRCLSVATDGSDFTVNAPYAVRVTGARPGCAADGLTRSIIVLLDKPLQQQGLMRLLVQKGSDGNSLVDDRNQQTPTGSGINFTVADTVNAAFSVALRHGCDRDTVQLKYTGVSTGLQFAWNLGDRPPTTGAKVDVVYPDDKSRRIQLAVSNGSCRDTAAGLVVFHSHVSADFAIIATDCQPGPVVFQGKASGPVVGHEWAFGDGSTASGASVTHAYPQALQSSGVFQVSYTVYDDIGCRSVISRPLTIYKNCRLAVPSAFAPGRPGKNALFKPLNIPPSVVFEFRVFNRWGQQVFFTREPNMGWNGSYQGKPQDAGTYLWSLHITRDDTARFFDQKGTVLLVR